MRNVAWPVELASWGALRGLEVITAWYPCAHGLRARPMKPARDEHARACATAVIANGVLLGRRRRPELLVAQCHAQGPGEPGHEAFVHRVNAYAEHFNLAYWVGDPFHPLALADVGVTVPVAYGRSTALARYLGPGADPSQAAVAAARRSAVLRLRKGRQAEAGR